MNEEKIEFPYTASVRFKTNKKAYTFGCKDNTLKEDDYVVVETIRGIELGQLITAPVPYVKSAMELKPILRKATKKDIDDSKENIELAKKAMEQCAKAILDLNLDMHLIEAEYTLDRGKVIFTYVADERVDFRELLKNLTAIFKCRIELRQIGPRDKAKLVGGLGSCGRETCCSKFLNDFDVVSINMAKNQLLALNIQKLSGQCGKLMCCLKYEDETYKDLKKDLPKINSQIEYEGNIYRITNMNVITRTAKIENHEDIQFLPFDELFSKGKLIVKNMNNKPKNEE